MLVFDEIAAIQNHLATERKKGHSIGFVPTMGALHKGHVSLLERSKSENDVSVCSIFVNPTQFNDKTDLEKYPRPIDADKLMLQQAGCDVLFAPTVDEIYPANKDKNAANYLEVKLGTLGKVMEGLHRPGHFNGVMQVVSRLFDIVNPDKAYFGQKDFQQQAIIKEMTRQLNYKVQIVTCPIVREADGLAMSSRNVRLGAEERKLAPRISKVLFKVKELANKFAVEQLMKMVGKELADVPQIQLEYFQIADAQTLEPLRSLEKTNSAVACIAVKLGGIRLIDNVILK